EQAPSSYLHAWSQALETKIQNTKSTAWYEEQQQTYKQILHHLIQYIETKTTPLLLRKDAPLNSRESSSSYGHFPVDATVWKSYYPLFLPYTTVLSFRKYETTPPTLQQVVSEVLPFVTASSSSSL